MQILIVESNFVDNKISSWKSTRLCLSACMLHLREQKEQPHYLAFKKVGD